MSRSDIKVQDLKVGDKVAFLGTGTFSEVHSVKVGTVARILKTRIDFTFAIQGRDDLHTERWVTRAGVVSYREGSQYHSPQPAEYRGEEHLKALESLRQERLRMDALRAMEALGARMRAATPETVDAAIAALEAFKKGLQS